MRTKKQADDIVVYEGLYVSNRYLATKRTMRASVLLEAILALLFAVMTISAVAGLLVTSMRRVRQADNRVRAMLLAENKLAELRTGLLDASKSNTGMFIQYPNFHWSYEYEPTEIPEMNHLVITITFNDGSEEFEYRLHSLFSPILHLDSSQLRQLASDPVRLQSIAGGTGFTDIIDYAEMFPGGENLLKVFLAGGVPAMTDLFNKLVSGKIDPRILMEADANDEESFRDILAQSAGDESVSKLLAWSDYDTAGIGNPPDGLRSKEGIARQGAQVRDKTNTGGKQDSDKLTAGPMSRREAMMKIQEMLKRLARHRK